MYMQAHTHIYIYYGLPLSHFRFEAEIEAAAVTRISASWRGCCQRRRRGWSLV